LRSIPARANPTVDPTVVSDLVTDSVISWGVSADASFVIWDSHAFERDLLPRHLKHNHW
jgi:heat shock transcription factor, other eukaryote